jgi:hypothetical protein
MQNFLVGLSRRERGSTHHGGRSITTMALVVATAARGPIRMYGDDRRRLGAVARILGARCQLRPLRHHGCGRRGDELEVPVGCQRPALAPRSDPTRKSIRCRFVHACWLSDQMPSSPGASKLASSPSKGSSSGWPTTSSRSGSSQHAASTLASTWRHNTLRWSSTVGSCNAATRSYVRWPAPRSPERCRRRDSAPGSRARPAAGPAPRGCRSPWRGRSCGRPPQDLAVLQDQPLGPALGVQQLEASREHPGGSCLG